MCVCLQEAGADALELNLSCPHGMGERGMGLACGQVNSLEVCFVLDRVNNDNNSLLCLQFDTFFTIFLNKQH